MQKAIWWFILSLVISIVNDSCVKYLAIYLPNSQSIFLRFALSCLLLLPIAIKTSSLAVDKVNLLQMITRGAITALAMLFWCQGLKEEYLVSATIIGFIIPFIVLIMSRLILKEKLVPSRLLACSVAFIGVLIAHYSAQNMTVKFSHYLIFAAVIFAFIDVLNKKYIEQNNIFVTMFYVFFGAAITSVIPAFMEWQSIPQVTILPLLILIIGTTLILFALLKSLVILEVGQTALLRFIELLFAIGFGAIFFNERPTLNMIIGGAVIIASLSLYALQEAKQKRFKKE